MSIRQQDSCGMSLRSRLRIAFWGMAAPLTAALTATFAMGFGAPIPEAPVIAGYVVGTAAMVYLFTVLILSAKGKPGH